MRKAIKYFYNIIPFKKYIFLLLRRFQLPETIYKHLHFKDIIRVKANEKYFLIRHHGFEIENTIFWSGLTGGWEKVSMKLWIELCEDSNVVIDIGANTGIYSLVTKTINPLAKVFAFEPVTRVYDKLILNCELNKYDINCLQLGVSNYDGTATIFDTSAEHVLSVTLNRNTLSQGTRAIETKINTKKLSSFIRENNLETIDLMKIDVETHEPEVLEGMEEYLQKFKPTILIEVLTDELGRKVESFFQNLGYLYFDIDEIGAPQKVNHILKSRHFNYLICSEVVARKLKLI